MSGGDECEIDTIVTLPSVRNEEESQTVKVELKSVVTRRLHGGRVVYHHYERRGVAEEQT